jgi:DNA polymerase elongation subunit (family B)
MVPDDVVFQVAFTTKVYGSPDPPVQKCFCLKETPGHEWFQTEKDMLMAVSKYIREQDFDILTGWNIFGFDLEYLYRRMEMTKCPMDTFYLGRKLNEPSLLVYKTLASSALGENVLKMVPMPGRFVFDLFQTIKAGYKLDSYSLNNVSKEFLGDSKLDMPIKEMFEHYRTGNAAKLGEVADYCLKDTELPIKIMEKLFTVENLIEMAKATWVPMNYLVERGQQIKVFSQVAKKARELGFMIPYIDKPKVATEYEGATVLDACTGAYYKPITALDFASLYPSIMVAHNLCYSTLVMDPMYDNLPGIEYETHGEHRFAQNVPSLLPAILTDLRAFRKKAKKDMEAAKGTHMYPIYDGKQLAYKVSMNSVYGFTGATNGILPCLAIASTVTAQGRTMIRMSKEYVERHFEGARVRYGDSVMPGTPVLTENGPMCIESLGKDWKAYPGLLKTGTDKEQCELDGVKVWTSSGWSDVKRVIRHKCQKKIYRVLTHTGLVDVTEDHSLLGPNKELLKPKDVSVDTELLHGFPEPCDFVAREDYCQTKNQLDAQKVYCTLMYHGHIPYLNVYDEYITVNRYGRYQNTSVSVLHENYDGYVYDLETEDGTFQAGVGQLIVKNTDSIMVEFDTQGREGKEAIEYSWTLGERASKEITELFKKPNELELEKVYCPYFLYSKKRYAAKMWVKNKKGEMEMEKIDIKGLQVVRRDTCEFVRHTCQTALNKMLDMEKPDEYVEERKQMLLDGRVPMQELILSKRLGDSYKSSNLAHVAVRDKIQEREPGSEPRSGDRVQFILVDTGDKKAKMYQKAEDPEFAKTHGLPIDYGYYYKHQFLTPVRELTKFTE